MYLLQVVGVCCRASMY